MKKPEPHIDENGDRYFNLRQAAAIVGGITERTLKRFAEAGRTSFGFPLAIKRVPVLKHRAASPNRTPVLKPQTERIVVLERDVNDLKEIYVAVGRIEPGPWSPYELNGLEARANAVMRRRNREAECHAARPQA